jgi:2-keto-3-deoxy-L-fuconate dehydrogenase
MGQPEEIAKAVMYLASDDSSWTTGAIHAIDGGQSIK